MLDTQNQGPQCIDQQKESSMALQIRQHDRNPNLWWVSSPEDDVAYIARPGNHYRAGRLTGGSQGTPTLSAFHLKPSRKLCGRGQRSHFVS